MKQDVPQTGATFTFPTSVSIREVFCILAMIINFVWTISGKFNANDRTATTVAQMKVDMEKFRSDTAGSVKDNRDAIFQLKLEITRLQEDLKIHPGQEK